VQGGAKLPDVLGALAEGQFAALLGLKGLPADRDALINLLLQKGADSVLTQVGVGDDALRSKLVQALAHGAAKHIPGHIPGAGLGAGGPAVGAGQSKQEMLQTLVQTLTKSVMNLDERAAPLKKQALEAALLGLSQGVLATNAVTKNELADVFSNVSNQLRTGMSTQPAAQGDLLEELLAVIARRSNEG